MHLFMSDLHKDNNTMYFFKKKNLYNSSKLLKAETN